MTELRHLVCKGVTLAFRACWGAGTAFRIWIRPSLRSERGVPALSGLRGCSWWPGRGRQLLNTARASGGEGICEAPGKERCESSSGGGGVGEPGSVAKRRRVAGETLVGTVGLLCRGRL